jgi:hypothetical protein
VFCHCDDRGLDHGDIDRPIEFLPCASRHAKRIRADHPANPTQRVVVHDFSGRAADVRGMSHPGGHDEVEGGTIHRTGLLAGLFLAVLAALQFRLKLVFGHDQRIEVSILFHSPPLQNKKSGFYRPKSLMIIASLMLSRLN